MVFLIARSNRLKVDRYNIIEERSKTVRFGLLFGILQREPSRVTEPTSNQLLCLIYSICGSVGYCFLGRLTVNKETKEEKNSYLTRGETCGKERREASKNT